MINNGVPDADERVNGIVDRCNKAYEEFNRLSECTTDTKLAEAAREAIEATKEYSLMYENAATLLYMRQQDCCHSVSCKDANRCKGAGEANRIM